MPNPGLLGFVGFKAGMTRVLVVADKPKSPIHKMDVTVPATVIEVPPLKVLGVKLYKYEYYGLKSLTQALYFDKEKLLPKGSDDKYSDEVYYWLSKKIRLPRKDNYDFDKAISKVEETLDSADVIRIIAHTQPYMTGIGMKKPTLHEIQVGFNDIHDGFEYAKSLVGKDIGISDVFKVGEYVDVISVTKGKGFQGPVKRHHIRILQHKSRKTKRGVGSIGPWHPARVMYTVPRYGQMGLERRTEYNKQILKLGDNPEEVNPRGGFVRYGLVKNAYVMLKGSVPGVKKREVFLRKGMRAYKYPVKTPIIKEIALDSQQG